MNQKLAVFLGTSLLTIASLPDAQAMVQTALPSIQAEERSTGAHLLRVRYRLTDQISGQAFNASDIRVGLQNLQSNHFYDERQISETETGFLVPLGEYRVFGSGHFCGLVSQNVSLTEDIELSLQVWCE